MSVISEGLTTLAKVKTMLGIPTANTTDDTYLEDLIAAATFAMQEYCGRKFVRRNFNGVVGTHSQTSVVDEDYIYFSGKGSRRHSLPCFPISSSGFVLYSLATRDGNGTETWDTLVENVDYKVDRINGILTRLGGSFCEGVNNYRVTMAAGYQIQAAAPWVPYDLEHCCKVMVREAFKEIDRTSSEKIGDITRAYDMTKARSMVESVLDNYRADSNFM